MVVKVTNLGINYFRILFIQFEFKFLYTRFKHTTISYFLITTINNNVSLDGISIGPLANFLLCWLRTQTPQPFSTSKVQQTQTKLQLNYLLELSFCSKTRFYKTNLYHVFIQVIKKGHHNYRSLFCNNITQFCSSTDYKHLLQQHKFSYERRGIYKTISSGFSIRSFNWHWSPTYATVSVNESCQNCANLKTARTPNIHYK